MKSIALHRSHNLNTHNKQSPQNQFCQACRKFLGWGNRQSTRNKAQSLDNLLYTTPKVAVTNVNVPFDLLDSSYIPCTHTVFSKKLNLFKISINLNDTSVGLCCTLCLKV